ncbi:DUF2075 domain-containing protein [Corynebacterium pseudopelargi]|uniref:GIY-YIG domain-containing protein n=1 Tax=Corynebacterium pseudopelargi TaxID=2080757 RepID=A0A3G6IWF2_9CORY|nr:DUF2075 domain-containing protein [Corynebacterium pseudopelargi]AZA09893.1 hypothetical protein CPPEL_08950 [Corynebacterium pseudopelargi]
MKIKTWVERIDFTEDSLLEFESAELAKSEEADYSPRKKRAKYLLDYPTVYIVHSDASRKVTAYVGETNSIKQRTLTHIKADPKARADWLKLSSDQKSQMYVIGSNLFNKSMTLDVENRLIQYLHCVDAVESLNNGRTNPQRDYYSKERFDEVFSEIWKNLRRKDKKLFPTEQIIRDSAIFKASPYHRLSDEQVMVKNELVRRIYDVILDKSTGQAPLGEPGKLQVVTGEAGSGKTVLLSSLFFEVCQGETRTFNPENDDDGTAFEFQDLDAHLLVNHDEQLKVYEQIANKLGVQKDGNQRVWKPTRFINTHYDWETETVKKHVDLIIIDEAHLLWTQGKQSYRGKNQIEDLLKCADMVIAVYDFKQILGANAWIEDQDSIFEASNAIEPLHLSNQMRIAASEETVQWIRTFIDDGEILDFPEDEHYQVKVFDDPNALRAAIKKEASNTERGLSRLVATYDWPFKKGSKEGGGAWDVTIGADFSMPWNGQLKPEHRRAGYGDLAWAEQEHTINEVGSTFTIQGFDLNYAGVILGPSVKYRNGKVIISPEESCNQAATNKRTFQDGKKHNLALSLLRNELNVLMTRGVHGLYIYAVDEQLREALLQKYRG